MQKPRAASSRACSRRMWSNPCSYLFLHYSGSFDSWGWGNSKVDEKCSRAYYCGDLHCNCWWKSFPLFLFCCFCQLEDNQPLCKPRTIQARSRLLSCPSFKLVGRCLCQASKYLVPFIFTYCPLRGSDYTQLPSMEVYFVLWALV